MQPKRTNRVLRNIAALLVGQVTTTLLSLVVIVYIPRHIGPAAIGDLGIAGILTTLLASLLALGMSTLLIRDIARDHRKAPELIGAAMVIRMAMALPSLLIIGVVAWVVHYTPQAQILIAISAVGMVIGMLSGPIQAGFQAFEFMKYNSLTAVISEVIVVAASVAVVAAGGGVVMLSLVSLAAVIVELFLGVWWWRKLAPVHLNFNPKLIRYLLVGGLPFWATSLFLTIYLYVDSFMLSVMTNDSVVGWYSVPTKIFGFMLFVPTTLGTALFPALARLYKHSPREMVKMAQRSFNLITCFSLPIAVGGMLLAKQIVLTLYGLAFGPSIPVFIVLSAMTVPTYLNILVNQLLVATERQLAWTKVMAGACIVNPLLNFFLIGFYQRVHQNGAFGAAWALFLTEGVMAVIGIVLLPRGILGWTNIKSMGKSIAAAGLMALGVWYTRDYFLAVPIITGGAIYFAAVVLLGVLPREEYKTLQAIGIKVLRKVGIQRSLSRADAKAA